MIPNIEKLLPLIEEAVSQSVKDHDRIVGHLQECSQLGIKVQPVDINKSGASCTIEQEQEIRLGFSLCVAGSPQFIEDMLAERQKKGNFKSFQDFCERIDLDAVPEKFLTQCVEIGAFDSTDKSRSQLFKEHKQIIQAVRKAKADRASNQFSLFALPITPVPKKTKLAKAAAEERIEEWNEEELIAHEKGAVGFSFTEYLTQQDADAATDEEASDVAPEPIETPPVVRETPPIITPAEPPVAIAAPEIPQPEQPPAPIINESPAPEPEIIAPPMEFTPDELESSFPNGVSAAESPKVEPPPPVPTPNAVAIQLSTVKTTEHTLLQLRSILEAHRGTLPVTLEFYDEQHVKTVVKTHADYSIQLSEAVTHKIEKLVGSNAIRVQY